MGWDNVAAKIKDRFKPLVAVADGSGVWLFPCHTPKKADAPLVCHVVNPHFDAQQDVALPTIDVPVRLRNQLFGGRRISIYYTSENDPHILEHRIEESNVCITIPRVDVWGILTIE